MITSLTSMTSVIPMVSKKQHFHLLYTLNDFIVISSFRNLIDLSSLTGLRGCTEFQCLISSKNLKPYYLA